MFTIQSAAGRRDGRSNRHWSQQFVSRANPPSADFELIRRDPLVTLWKSNLGSRRPYAAAKPSFWSPPNATDVLADRQPRLSLISLCCGGRVSKVEPVVTRALNRG